MVGLSILGKYFLFKMPVNSTGEGYSLIFLYIARLVTENQLYPEKYQNCFDTPKTNIFFYTPKNPTFSQMSKL